MTITCNKIPEKKPELTSEQKLNRLALMYHLGEAARAADPVGMKLVSDLMLAWGKPKHVQEEIARKLRKHFGIKTKKEVEIERAKAIKKAKQNARREAMDYTIFMGFNKIGYKPIRGQKFAYRSEYGNMKDLWFDTAEDAKAWLVKAECWDEKMYQDRLDICEETNIGIVKTFGRF